MKSVELIKQLEAAGWLLDRVRRSHHVFKRPIKLGHITVPHPNKDLGKGLVGVIKKAAGI